MSSQDLLSIDGTVTDTLPNQEYLVRLETGQTIRVYSTGKMRKHNIRCVVGDSVTVEVSPYNPALGRLTRRHK